MAETVVVQPEQTPEVAAEQATSVAVSEAAATERTEICETQETARAQVAADAAVAIAETAAEATEEEIDELEESVSFLRQRAEESSAAMNALAAGQATLSTEVAEIKSSQAKLLELLTPRSQETVTEQVSTSETIKPETVKSENTPVVPKRLRRLM